MKLHVSGALGCRIRRDTFYESGKETRPFALD